MDRIDYSTVSPEEMSFVVTDEVKRFLELKYASVIFNSDPKESDAVKKTLSGVFTDENKEELDRLEKIFSERRINYAWLLDIMYRKYSDVISKIHKSLMDKRNKLLNENNLF